jgi:hypothetical protein
VNCATAVVRAVVVALLIWGGADAFAQISMRDSGDTVPPGWTGPKFAMSKNYPSTKPTEPGQPWRQLNFRTQSEQYIKAVLDYALEGNVEAGWVVQNNAVRKWYHAPGLARGSNGREFIHGMTRERTSNAGDLHANQTTPVDNWAVGFYNPIGGYTLGRVWANPTNPDVSKAKFSNGAVAVKLLFTTATVTQVPYLAGTFEWQGNIGNTPTARTPKTLRLAQVDLAVRDTRNSSRTGWVFGTFVYQNTAAGTDPWKKLVPVGLMWGNDPSLDPSEIDNGAQLQQQWLNQPLAGSLTHLGWKGRLNGPVDNKESSCLSCHATAGFPSSPMLPAGDAPVDQKMEFFRNIKAGKHALADRAPLDYSLQLAFGIRNHPPTSPPSPTPPSPGAPAGAGAPAIAAAPAPAPEDEEPPRNGIRATGPMAFLPVSAETDGDPKADEKPDVASGDDDEAAGPGVGQTQAVATAGGSHLWLWVVLGVVALVVVIWVVLMRGRSGAGASRPDTPAGSAGV